MLYSILFSLYIKFYLKSLLLKPKQNINTSECLSLIASPSSPPDVIITDFGVYHSLITCILGCEKAAMLP